MGGGVADLSSSTTSSHERSSVRRLLLSDTFLHLLSSLFFIVLWGDHSAEKRRREEEGPSSFWLSGVIMKNPFSTCLTKPIDHVHLSLQLSLVTNVLVVASMLFIAIRSGSLALLSSLVENVIDLFVQSMLWWAGTNSRKVDYAKYPAGKSRYEPVSIIIAASLMGISAVLVVQESISRLIAGFSKGDISEPGFSPAAIVVVSLAISTKVFIYFYCVWVFRVYKSFAVEAIAQDNRNDVISNAFAVIAFAIAANYSHLWYIDSLGAIVIFIFIGISWGFTAKDQILQLVGVTADSEFVDRVRTLSDHHHPDLVTDIIRAYHFGSKYLVELEVILPANMIVKDAHDIALQLQFKLEQLDEVERAFVHVDYRSRDYDEHVVSREKDALLRYVGPLPGIVETPVHEDDSVSSDCDLGSEMCLEIVSVTAASPRRSSMQEHLLQNT